LRTPGRDHILIAKYETNPILVELRGLLEIADAAPSLTCLRILIDPSTLGTAVLLIMKESDIMGIID
jgi:hypothetical protein